MATKDEVKQQKEKEFMALLCEVQEFLKQNPNHVGTIAKTDGKLGRRLYTLSEIRRGKRPSTIYGQKHFSVLDNMLPGWDNYGLSRLKFDEFCNALQKFTNAKNAYYDKLNVPEVLRDLHVPNECKVDKYDLGRRIIRVKSGFTALTQEQIEIINNINPQCLAKAPTYDLPRFYMALRDYVAKKEKDYDSLDVPEILRDYRVTRDAIIGDYKIGVRFRYFRDNWLNLTEAQQECFLKLVPNLLGKQQCKGFDFKKFYTEYAKFVDNKNKYYDKLGTPIQLRSYYIHRNQQIFGEPLGEKLYYIQKNYALSPKEEEALNKLNPKWREKSHSFDFGEFYGHFLQFRKQRNAYYDERKVPQEQRKYTVFPSTYVDSYPLGNKLYLIRTKRIAISDSEKEALLKIDPNCLSGPMKAAPVVLMHMAKKKCNHVEP